MQSDGAGGFAPLPGGRNSLTTGQGGYDINANDDLGPGDNVILFPATDGSAQQFSFPSIVVADSDGHTVTTTTSLFLSTAFSVARAGADPHQANISLKGPSILFNAEVVTGFDPSTCTATFKTLSINITEGIIESITFS
jgi:hypothetical protein